MFFCFVRYTSQIAMACARFGGPNIVDGATDDILLRGGVSANSYFVERLKANFEEQVCCLSCVNPNLGVTSEWKQT